MVDRAFQANAFQTDAFQIGDAFMEGTLTVGEFEMFSRAYSAYQFPAYPPPDFPLTVQRKMKLMEGGQGAYKEYAPDGINWKKSRTIPLRWSTLTFAEKETMSAFLEERGGAGRFLYAIPHGTGMETFKCPSWQFSYAFEGRWTLQATFERRVDPTQG